MNIPFSSRPINHLESKGIPRGLYRATSSGMIWSTESESMLKSQRRKDGYYEVDLKYEGKRVKQKVHRLVCRAFHGPPDSDSMEANHCDGDRSNNRPDNLEWTTHSENILHRNNVLRSNPGGKRAKPVGIIDGGEIQIFKSHTEAIAYLSVSPPQFYDMLKRREAVYPISNTEAVKDERYEDKQRDREGPAGKRHNTKVHYPGTGKGTEGEESGGSEGESGPETGLSEAAQRVLDKWKTKGQRQNQSQSSAQA